MNTAHNSQRHAIRAEDAERGGIYTCRRCGVRAVLARGRIQADHFRHVGRTPAERKRARDCELYVASQLSPGGSGVNRTEPVEPPARLYLSWFDHDSRIGWALHLVPPRYVGNNSVSFFRIDEDAQTRGQRDIPFGQLLLKRFMVRARPGTYQVRGFSKLEQVVWRPPSTAQLSTSRANVFEVSSTGGYLLDSDEAIVPGRTYVVLNYKSKLKRNPPKDVAIQDLVRSITCDPTGIWRAYLLFLPPYASVEMEEWCYEVLGRSIAESPASLQLIFPPAVERDDGVLVVDDQNAIILFLGTGWPEDSMIELTDPKGVSTDRPLLAPSRFHQLQGLNLGTFELHLRDDSQVLSQRITVEVPSVPRISGVVLNVSSSSKSEIEGIDLLDMRASDVWKAIITRSISFERLDIPDGLSLELYWQRHNGEQEQRKSFDANQFATALKACLDSSPRHSRLDAGPFGMVEWNAPIPSFDSSQCVELSPILDARLRWLLQAYRGGFQQQGERLNSPVRASDLKQFSVSARPIVKAFSEIPQWSPALLPYARSMAWDLANLMNAGN